MRLSTFDLRVGAGSIPGASVRINISYGLGCLGCLTQSEGVPDSDLTVELEAHRGRSLRLRINRNGFRWLAHSTDADPLGGGLELLR
jgi:hypothetical protein